MATSTSNDTILSTVSQTDMTIYEQLEQLKIEIDELKSSNEVLKISARDLLERAPPLINIPCYSTSLQETLDDIIEKQAREIQRLRSEIQREKSRCLIAINELELKWEEQFKELPFE